jgi:hypothetical protein
MTELDELAEEIYAVSAELNELLKEASEHRLYVPLHLEEQLDGAGRRYQIISNPVYVKLVPGYTVTISPRVTDEQEADSREH